VTGEVVEPVNNTWKGIADDVAATRQALMDSGLTSVSANRLILKALRQSPMDLRNDVRSEGE
jgi:hypothetical protein